MSVDRLVVIDVLFIRFLSQCDLRAVLGTFSLSLFHTVFSSLSRARLFPFPIHSHPSSSPFLFFFWRKKEKNAYFHYKLLAI